jgi:hypothetical protein
MLGIQVGNCMLQPKAPTRLDLGFIQKVKKSFSSAHEKLPNARLTLRTLSIG